MARQHFSSGSIFEERIGYARATVDGDWVFVSGTTGFDYATGTIADDVVEQAERCIANIEAALEGAGFAFADVVRVRYILPVAADFERCWPTLRRHFGPVRPAATMWVAGLLDRRMKIEIEVTGRHRHDRPPSRAGAKAWSVRRLGVAGRRSRRGWRPRAPEKSASSQSSAGEG